MDYTFLHNPLRDWILAAGTMVAVYFLASSAKTILRKQLKKPAPGGRAVRHEIASRLLECVHSLFVLAVAIYAGTVFLSLPSIVDHIIEKILFLTILLLNCTGQTFCHRRFHHCPRSHGNRGVCGT